LEALSGWSNFEPRPGQPNAHDETLHFPEAFTAEIEEAWTHPDNLAKLPIITQLPDFRHKAMKDFSLGFRKFATPPSLGRCSSS
jgi:hypothetical protein